MHAAFAQSNPPRSPEPRSSHRSLRVPPGTEAKLAQLYAALEKAPNAEAAKPIENRIEALRLESGSPTADLLMARARLSAAAKDRRLTLELLDAVVKSSPGFIEARAQRATIYYENKDIARALADLRAVVAKDPRHYGAMTGLGIIFEELGEDKLALDAFRRALAVDPYVHGVPERVKSLTLKVEGREI